MDSNYPSGMYKCTSCLNVETHIQGEEFTPCPKCNTNNWEIIKKDKDYLISTHQTNSVHSEIKLHNY